MTCARRRLKRTSLAPAAVRQLGDGAGPSRSTDGGVAGRGRSLRAGLISTPSRGSRTGDRVSAGPSDRARRPVRRPRPATAGSGPADHRNQKRIEAQTQLGPAPNQIPAAPTGSRRP